MIEIYDDYNDNDIQDTIDLVDDILNNDKFEIKKLIDDLIVNITDSTETKYIIGYKGFDFDLTCNDIQYNKNTLHIFTGKMELYTSGYHFCDNPRNVLDMYNEELNTYAIIKVFG